MKITNLKKETWTGTLELRNVFSKEITHEEKNHQFEKWSFEWCGKSYRTDNDGDGLWCNEKQLTGTCQFSLRGMSISGARKRLNKQFDNLPV